MCREEHQDPQQMMAVMGVLKGHSTRTASDFADVDQRTVQLWVARFNEGSIDGLRDAPGRGRASRARYGRIRSHTWILSRIRSRSCGINRYVYVYTFKDNSFFRFSTTGFAPLSSYKTEYL